MELFEIFGLHCIDFLNKEVEFNKTEQAVHAAFDVYRKALGEGVDKYLVGPAIKPVFRKYN